MKEIKGLELIPGPNNILTIRGVEASEGGQSVGLKKKFNISKKYKKQKINRNQRFLMKKKDWHWQDLMMAKFFPW